MSSGAAVSLGELGFLPAALRAPRRPRAEIERRTLAGVRAMLAFARGTVPHYADPAYDVGELDTLADLARLPLLTKRAVLAAGPERFHTPGLRASAYRVDHTNGTTGVALEVRHDVASYGYHGATILRRFRAAGYLPWWRIAQVKPFPRPVRWFQRLGVFPRVVVDSTLPVEELRRGLVAVRPRVLMAYPVVLRSVLRGLPDAEAAALRRTLRCVLTDSELLTDADRAWFADALGAPVFDEYSAYEVLTVGSDCRAGAMHVDEDRVVLEIVDDDGRPVPDGEEGGVVVTHFRERAMPLVRYALGDRAVRLPPGCPCGSHFRRMAITSGRADDHVVIPDGRELYMSTFGLLLNHTPGVAEAMVRQDAAGAITVHLVVDPTAGRTFDEAAAGYAAGLRDALGVEVPIRYVRADRLDLAGGKGRFIESAYRPSASAGT